MKVLVDSTVWSLMLRRRATDLNPRERRLRQVLLDLLAKDSVALIGPIRQEVLSGIRSKDSFHATRIELDKIVDLVLEKEDYENAAVFYNTCRAQGVAGAHVDFLICAVAKRHGLAILTTDADFDRYARHLPIQLHPLHS